MKTNYFFKQALLIVALFGFNVVFAQTAKTTNFVEVVSPVITGVDEQQNPIKAEFAEAFECAAAWGDYNNDGYLDMMLSGVSANWAKITKLYKNNGNGTFTIVETPFPGLRAASVTWFDFNNDGNLDVLLSGNDEIGVFTVIYKNLGAPNYDFQQMSDDGFTFVNIGNGQGNKPNRYTGAADYDNDGWVDFVITGEMDGGTKTTVLYKNINGKRFQEINTPVNGTDLLAQGTRGTLAWADVNKDGYMDFITSGKLREGAPEAIGLTHTTGAFLYINKKDGTFETPVQSLGAENGDIVWFDYDNDGKLDYLLTGQSESYNRTEAGVDGQWNWDWHSDIFTDEGQGSWRRINGHENLLEFWNQEGSVDINDVNNDGYDDILIMSGSGNSVYFNNSGDQTFGKMKLEYTSPTNGNDPNEFGRYTGAQWGGTACMVDYDNDGNLDVFTAAYGFRPRLMRNALAESLTGNQTPTAPTGLQSVVSAGGKVTFNWTAGTDTETPAEVLKYNLYIKKNGVDSLIMILPANISTGRLKVNERLAGLSKTSYEIMSLTDGTYTVGVQTIDNARVASQFTTAQFIVGPNALGSNLESEVSIISNKNFIRISSTENIQGNVVIYNSNGLEVYAKSGKIENNQINLPAGVYVVKVVSNLNTMVRKAIVR